MFRQGRTCLALGCTRSRICSMLIYSLLVTLGILQSCAFGGIVGTASKEGNGSVHDGPCGICVLKLWRAIEEFLSRRESSSDFRS